MSKNVFSGKFDPTEETKLRLILEKDGFDLLDVQHAYWQAKRERVFITFYRSGQVVIQGKNATDFAEDYLSSLKSKQSIHGLDSIKTLNNWIGTDESGKGDFFGPLVVAALYVDKKIEHKLWLLGVRDSKKISDQKISELANSIRKSFSHSVGTFSPDKYNKNYKIFNNLNQLLASAHAQVIKNLVEKTGCTVVLADKFGEEELIKNALGESNNFTLIQKNKAEANLAVAGASILARDKFINSLEQLSLKYQMNFPPGASNKVVDAAKRFVKHYGKDNLNAVAKTHFKTIKQL